MDGAAQLLDMVSKGGVLAVTVLIIWAFLTEKVVPSGRMEDADEHHRELVDQRKEAVEYNRRAYADTVRAIDGLTAEVKRAIDRLDRARR